jgi:hypothetical protein
MRPFLILPALCLLFGARASNLDSRAPAPLPLGVRQEDFSHACAALDTDFIVFAMNMSYVNAGVIGASTLVLNVMRCVHAID